MSIISAKFKAHRLVNYIFYLIIFIIGVFVGLGIKLFDNVNAYTITTSNGVPINEEYIINKFSSSISNFDANDYEFAFEKWNGQNYWTVYAIVKDSIALATQSSSGLLSFSSVNCNSLIGKPCYIKFNFTRTSVESSASRVYSGAVTITGSGFTSLEQYNSDFTYDYTSKKLLDFSIYQVPEMVFDEDLFADDNNFKEVCVNNYDTFSITSNDIQDYDNDNNPLYHSNDFIWFKNGVKGLSTYLYDSESEEHVVLFDNSDNSYLDAPYGWYFWFNSQEEIDTYWNSPNSPGIELVTKGYTDKYKYYNYTAYPFQMTFTTDYHKYQVFWFKNSYIEDLEGNITYPDKYCFYIRNDYDVNILHKNENGDLYGDINVLDDITFHDQTLKNEFSDDINGLFSNITNFLSRMYSTIIFINTNILNLYSSMPLLFRMFIMTFLTLIIVKILIGMVIK